MVDDWNDPIFGYVLCEKIGWAAYPSYQVPQGERRVPFLAGIHSKAGAYRGQADLLLRNAGSAIESSRADRREIAKQRQQKSEIDIFPEINFLKHFFYISYV